jgi:DnaJ-related protein SCJ1
MTVPNTTANHITATTCNKPYGIRRCNGTRTVEVRDHIEVHLEPGTPDEWGVTYQNKGHESPRRYTGNLVATFKFVPPVVANTSSSEHQLVRDGAMLRTTVSISLQEALGGFEREIKNLNGTVITLARTGVRATTYILAIQMFYHFVAQ